MRLAELLALHDNLYKSIWGYNLKGIIDVFKTRSLRSRRARGSTCDEVNRGRDSYVRSMNP